jgi:hypothetical protein
VLEERALVQHHGRDGGEDRCLPPGAGQSAPPSPAPSTPSPRPVGSG